MDFCGAINLCPLSLVASNYNNMSVSASCLKSESMVDDLGSSGLRSTEVMVCHKWLNEMAARRRFPVLSEAEAEDQVSKRGKVIALLGLVPFKVQCEREFEDWVDSASARALTSRVCPLLFKEAWAAASPEETRDAIMEVDHATHEEMVDAVALCLYPNSDYVVEVETDLLVGRRAPSVA